MSILKDLCFQAQQAAEKAIKGVLIRYKVDFPYIHYIAKLLTLVEGAGQNIPQHVSMADRLTQFAVITRYPDMAPPIKLAEYREMVKIAEDVVRWAEGIILS